MPKCLPTLKNSFNQAHLENAAYEQGVSHLQRELELTGLEASDEMEINTMTQPATKSNPEKPKETCYDCENLGHYLN